MAYNALNNLIDAYIYANGVQAITGQILNGVLKQMVAQLGSGYHLMGVAGPGTVPEQNDYAMAYFAATAGEYTGFGGITLAAGEVAVLLTYGNGSWAKQTIYNVPTGTADLENTANFITNAVADLVNYYTKTEIDTILEDYPTRSALATALADYYTKVETDTKLTDYYKKTETYDKDEVDSIVAALSRQEYIVAWDGLAEPDIDAIPAGVTVTYNAIPYTGTIAASASTVNKIYMVWNGVAYDMYGTSQDGGYSWVPMGTTTVDLSNYAKEEDLNHIAEKLQNVTYYPVRPGDEEIVEFQTNGGGFIAKVSPSGVEAVDVKARIGGESVSLTGIYKDEADTLDDSLSIGDNNKKNIVQFERGHVITKYFSSEEVIKDIEELKNGGATGTVDDKAQRKMAFKEDFFSYKYGKANSAWYERLRIMHYSDTHRNIVNLKEALGLAQGLVHLVLDTGDNANGIASTSSASTITELNDYLAAEEEVNTAPMPMLICTGNHDVPNLTKKQYFDIMCSIVAETNPSFVFGDATNYRTYGYVDITPNATIGTVRVISLDPFDYEDGQFMNPYGASGGGGWMNCVFSQKQIDWLIATLRSAANNGYKVITAMHYSWGDNPVFTDSGSANPDANYHQDPFMIPDIIEAMQNRTTLSKSYPDDENINNITVNENFSGLTNPLDFVCHLFGHIHSENEYQCQKTDGSKFYDILMVGAPNMGSEGYFINKVPIQPNTINSIKCTVLEIDTVEKNIYRVNYGAYKAYDMSNTERTKKIHYRFNL